MTDLNIDSELLIDCVACVYYHKQSKNKVRPVVTAMVKSNATQGESI